MRFSVPWLHLLYGIYKGRDMVKLWTYKRHSHSSPSWVSCWCRWEYLGYNYPPDIECCLYWGSLYIIHHSFTLSCRFHLRHGALTTSGLWGVTMPKDLAFRRNHDLQPSSSSPMEPWRAWVGLHACFLLTTSSITSPPLFLRPLLVSFHSLNSKSMRMDYLWDFAAVYLMYSTHEN